LLTHFGLDRPPRARAFVVEFAELRLAVGGVQQLRGGPNLVFEPADERRGEPGADFPPLQVVARNRVVHRLRMAERLADRARAVLA
jgi:hypothetical protein